MGHPDTLGNASLILVLTDRVTATSLSLGEASRSVCRRCWQEKRAELSQRHTYGAPSEGREAHEIATPLYVAHLHPNKCKLRACDRQLNVSYQSWDKYPQAKPLP